MKRLRSRTGQIVIPALMIFPTLCLFVYLIYETAKLSRQKIQHQFAMDAAAFVEMTNYSDFLNRTAYVNGAFPMRIFEEGYGDFPAECEGKTANCVKKMYADILYENGAYPRSQSGKHTFTDEASWDIAYIDKKNGSSGGPPVLEEPFELFKKENAFEYWHQYDLATEIYKLYVQMYSLLGSVEDAQFSVLKRLSKDHSFIKKSYWMNTGDSIGDAALLANNFGVAMGSFEDSVQPYCQETMDYWGNRHLGGSGLQPYTPAHADPIIQLETKAPCSKGLFQVMYVKQNMIKKLRDKTGDYPGLLVWMNWSVPPKNYWNIDFPTLLNQSSPQGNLRTTISLQGDPSSKPAVWPYPTPKFQVRQYP
jgi:hypothetical protein